MSPGILHYHFGNRDTYRARAVVCRVESGGQGGVPGRGRGPRVGVVGVGEVHPLLEEAVEAAAAKVDAEMALGQELGVTGTPGFFVNGTFLNGAQPVEAFVPLIEKAQEGVEIRLLLDASGGRADRSHAPVRRGPVDAQSGRSARFELACSQRATTSFPVPCSPVMRTLASDGPTRSMMRSASESLPCITSQRGLSGTKNINKKNAAAGNVSAANIHRHPA